MFEIRDMPLVDLRPTGYARLYDMTILIERQLFLIPAGERHGLGARANPAHFAFQDIDDLRQLIDPRLAKKRAHPGDAWIAIAGDRIL